jgi:hypothetical protein
MVRIFKGDYQTAADDLTAALQLHRLYQSTHPLPKLPQQEGQPSEKRQSGGGRRQPDIILKEADQPCSLELQLLFHRAGAYLAIACSHVAAALPTSSDAQGAAEPPPESEVSPETAHKETQRRMAEARKLVRLNAKRALRDYMAYIAHFEYSPDLPIEIAEDFARKVNSAVNGARPPRSQSYPPGPR